MNSPETQYTVVSISSDKISSGLIKTLLYFDIFHYPLTAQELQVYGQTSVASEQEIHIQLKELVNQKLISEKEGFYYIRKDEKIVERRKRGNNLAEKYFKRATLCTKLIARFPFVRGVCISGSLSKGYMDKNSDIDYFIITEPGRLWLSRTLLILFKKLFLFNSFKYFCVNYFIDTENLEIPDKNLFTATELAFIKPTYNYDLYVDIMRSNAWIKHYYHNIIMESDKRTIRRKKYYLKAFSEWILNGNIGEYLDTYFFKLTIRRWKKKFNALSDEHFDVNLRSKKNTSKHHPQGFQWKVLQQHAEKISLFEQEHDMKLI